MASHHSPWILLVMKGEQPEQFGLPFNMSGQGTRANICAELDVLGFGFGRPKRKIARIPPPPVSSVYP